LQYNLLIPAILLDRKNNLARSNIFRFKFREAAEKKFLKALKLFIWLSTDYEDFYQQFFWVQASVFKLSHGYNYKHNDYSTYSNTGVDG
jgi:hypothetical protein